MVISEAAQCPFSIFKLFLFPRPSSSNLHSHFFSATLSLSLPVSAALSLSHIQPAALVLPLTMLKEQFTQKNVHGVPELQLSPKQLKNIHEMSSAQSHKCLQKFKNKNFLS